MTKRPDNPQQLDLFAWADRRPTAKILNAIPHIAKRMWRERLEPIAQREGRLIGFPPTPIPIERPSRRTA